MTNAPLPVDYTLEEVAQALGMSPRWVRDQCSKGAVHNRYGLKIRFTAEQVEALRNSKTKNAGGESAKVTSITTGKKRK